MAVTPVMAPPRLPVWLVAVLLLLVTIALYWPATRGEFVNFDDGIYVRLNPHVQSGLNWQSIQWAFSTLDAGFWHPLTWLSILVDCQLFGLQPWGHHLTSVLLHAANTVLLFLVLQRLTGATWRSAFVAGLFGWHPLHVESVAWVSERKDVLSAFFLMLTMLMYVCYVVAAGARGQEPDRGAQGEGPDARKDGALRGNESLPRVLRQPSRYYTLALVCFVCALMSKPMVVTLPLMLLLLDWWPLQRLPFKTPGLQLKQMLPVIWEKVPFLAAALLAGVVTIYAEKGVGALGAATAFPLAGRVQNALVSYVAYLIQTLWPADLAVYYPHPGTYPAWLAAGAGLVALLLSVLLLWAPRKRPYLAMGWIWYLVTLLPVIGFIQIGGFSRADRYTYVPLIGIFLALTWGACELTQRWRHQALSVSVAGGAVMALCLVLTRQQIGYWKDNESLVRHEIDCIDKIFRRGRIVTEQKWMARYGLSVALLHYNFGIMLDKNGQTVEAIRQYQEALRLNPDDAEVHNSLGAAFDDQGQTDEAIRQYQEALRLKPDHADAHNNLGIALGRQGQTSEAIRRFQETLRLKPDHADAHYNLGVAFGQQGQTVEAVRQLQEALRLKPDHAEAHNNLGTVFYQQGLTDEAIRQFQEALRLKPDYPNARKNLDAVLAARAHSSPPPGAATQP
jgi:tetratricopeptide (TPR) repeat protein